MNAYTADVYYTASDYPNAPELKCDALRVFYVSANSFGEAAEKVLDDFKAYQKVQTSSGGKYAGLSYHLNGMRIEKAI